MEEKPKKRGRPPRRLQRWTAGDDMDLHKLCRQFTIAHNIGAVSGVDAVANEIIRKINRSRGKK